MNSGLVCSHSPVSHWSISRWAIGEPITVNAGELNLQLADDGAKRRVGVQPRNWFCSSDSTGISATVGSRELLLRRLGASSYTE
ncbi:MAG: hypothetical protein ACRDNF_25700 [Streptosporangiaceae bacterium]